MTLFDREPIERIDGIPVFSGGDRYVRNYERIAGDHVAAIDRGIDNPFMDSVLWAELEASTRALLVRHLPPGARMLDVGVGLGRLLGPLDQFVRHGIDISLDYLGHARQAGIEVAYARIEDMPYRDAVFDAAVCCDVLEHVLDLHACTRQVVRVIKPGGLLFVRVPFEEDLSSYLDPASPYEFVHLRNFDVAGLRLHFEKIMGCAYVEHAFTRPYFNGAPRLKLRLLPEPGTLATLLAGPDDGRPDVLAPLRAACQVSEGQIVGLFYSLREQDPARFAALCEQFVLPLELNMVFRTPLAGGQRHAQAG